MSGGVFIEGNVLGKRLGEIYKDYDARFRTGGGGEGEDAPCAAVAVATGKSTEDLRYMKSIALEMWLFAYELPETLIVLLRNKEVHVVTGKTKAKLIAAAKEAAEEQLPGLALTIHTRAKGTTGEDEFKAVLAAVESAAGDGASAAVGHLAKDKHEGSFFDTWSAALGSTKALASVDVSAGFAEVLAVKSSDEQTNAKKAAYLSSQAMVKYVIPQLETIIDEEKKVKHSTLSSLVEDRILEPSKLEVRLKRDKVNTCYSPVVQSGGNYNLKITAQSNSDLLK